MMNNICSINRITPFQGFVRALPYRRAMPHVNDNGLSAQRFWEILKKAESLLINSVGQRPTEKNGVGITINKLTKTKLICLKKKQ